MSFKKTNNFDDGIAVVGVSALYPGSVGATRFWSNILAGHDFMTEIPADHWLIDDYYDPDPTTPGKTYAKRGAFLPKVDFDPLKYGIPPKQLSSTDTTQLLGIVVAQQVLEDAASVQFGNVDKRNISVILGIASATELVAQMASRIQRPNWVKALREAGLPESQVEDICQRIEGTYPEWDESTFPGLLGNVVAGRIANRLDLGGTNCVVDAACASSLGAVTMAVQELRSGHSDLVITGGADTLNDIFMYMCFSKTPALSPTGDCRPFSEAADGTMLGEGIGMVALRRLEDAERDGDKIYAVLRGIGSSSDGRAKSIYAPRAEGQEIAIRRAYEHAGYGPDQVGMVEAHGTATRAGDNAEFEGLRRAFSDTERKDKQWCALGSIKSQIGHTKAAAGAASLFKVVMALHHKVLPPTIKVDQPNTALDIENSPFYLNTQCRPWVHPLDSSRKASVSSFGFGGSNFHIALEEYTGDRSSALRQCNLPRHLLLIGAENADALLAELEVLKTKLSDSNFPTMARDSQLKFSPDSACRLALLADTAKSAITELTTASKAIASDPQQDFSLQNRMHYAAHGAKTKLAFLFPGQGSQYVNMGAELAMEFDVARRVWDETVHILDDAQPLHNLVFPIPVFNDTDREHQNTALMRTDRAQPAIGATSLSMLRMLERLGVRPDATAGHSYGEVAALHAAGAIPTSQSLFSISRKRGELMRKANADGAMLAVRAPMKDVESFITEHAMTGITVANINSPNQVVVAGETPVLETFQQLLENAEVVCRRLPVATAFHTELVAGCVEPFADFLAEQPFSAPVVPVYANTTATPYPADDTAIRSTLSNQLAQPVRFADMIERMYADGHRVFVEVGPGSVLTGLVGDCLQDKEHAAIALDGRHIDGRVAFLNALGMLSVYGFAIDYQTFWSEFAPIERYQDETSMSPASVKLNGANFGKPYPPVEGAAGRPLPNPEKIIQEKITPEKNTLGQPKKEQPTVPKAVVSPPDNPPAAARNTSTDTHWTSSFEVMQRQMLEAQKAFTQTLSESHNAFLRASEVAFMQLGQTGGSKPGMLPAVPSAQQEPSISDNGVHTAPHTPGNSVDVVASASTAPILPDTAVPASASQSNETLLLEVVADKTGYPVEMLSLDMELEAGLGIDSIKRVEILSVLQEKIPQLAEVDTSKLAALNTLGEIVDFAAQTSPVPSPRTTTASSSRVEERPAAESSVSSSNDYETLLLQVVADKTGYPVEMLSLDMELEAGLGIDSIKRVEILSVLHEKIPQLAVDTSKLATLNTLGEIVDFAAHSAPVNIPPAVTVPSTKVTEQSTTETVVSSAKDYETLLLQVVADKTGYPVDILSLDMELEAGLGIDSIKRVEILSVLQEKIPQLADVDTSKLAALNTLGEIVDFAAHTAPVHIPPAAIVASSMVAEHPAAESLISSEKDYENLLLQVVADKTGYPVEMLSLDMELEAGLGIDSIKRVEILSVLQEKIPQLADVDTSKLAALNTLGEIVDFAAHTSPVQTISTSAAPSPIVEERSAAESLVPSAKDYEALLLQIVADKTGYPVEMLSLDMELEAGLGIDSIKRVEILSILQEKIPQLADIDTSKLATLNTLEEIVSYAVNSSTSVHPSSSQTARDKVMPGAKMHRLSVRAEEAPAPGFATSGLFAAEPLYLVATEQKVADLLAERLALAGIGSHVVTTPPVDARSVVLLTGLDPIKAGNEARINEAVFTQLQACAETMAREGRLLITVQATGGDFGMAGAGERAWTAGIGAAAKTAALEWPHVSVKAIDIELNSQPDEAIADAICRELLTGGDQREVGLKANGTRIIPLAIEETSPTPVKADIDATGVFVVTGGARGVTAACLEALISRVPVKLAIFGRTPLQDEPAGLATLTTDAELKRALLQQHTTAGEQVLPQQLSAEVRRILALREVRNNLNTFAALGAEVRYYTVNVNEPAAVSSALTEVRKDMGPIRGLVHAAGVLADKSIEHKTLEQFQWVLRTKVDGFKNLLDATRQDALTHIACFSSVAARTGNIGQIDYAMANEVLNRVCREERARRTGCLVKAIGWGPWDGGMVDASLGKHFAAMGVPLIPLKAGARLFADEITGLNGDAPEIVFGGGLEKFATGHLARPDNAVFDVRFHHDTHPYIASHVIRDVPVVPMVTAIDLALHATQALRPGEVVASCANIKVVKGIQLPHFNTTGDRYLIECRISGDRAAVRLLAPDSTVHYTLEVVLGELPREAFGCQNPAPLPRWLPKSGEIYDGRLFSGPDLQVIEALEGIDENGCVGLLHALGTKRIGLWADITVLDGGLQLAVLWGHDYTGVDSLPTSIEKFQVFRPWPNGIAVRCEATCNSRSTLQSRWTVHYRTTEGEPLASIQGLQLHHLPHSVSDTKAAQAAMAE